MSTARPDRNIERERKTWNELNGLKPGDRDYWWPGATEHGVKPTDEPASLPAPDTRPDPGADADSNAPTPMPPPAAGMGEPDAGNGPASTEADEAEQASEIGPDAPRVPAREDWQRYRDLGWSVLPVGANKRPMVKWEPYQTRHATDEEVAHWVSKGWYIAVATGKISGVNSVEYDGTEAPPDFAAFPETAQQQTFGKEHNGGVHSLFKWTQPTQNATKKRGFDIRGDGGYIVVPPFADGRKWLRDPELGLAEAPAWVSEPESSTSASSNGDQAPTEDKLAKWLANGADHGERNDAESVVLGYYIRRTPEKEWEPRAWPEIQGWNRLNRPPIDLKELRTTFESICREERKNHPDYSAKPWHKPIGNREITLTGLGDMIEAMLQAGEQKIFWFVKGVLPARGRVRILAKPKMGKSIFIAQSLYDALDLVRMWGPGTNLNQLVDRVFDRMEEVPKEEKTKASAVWFCLEEASYIYASRALLQYGQKRYEQENPSERKGNLNRIRCSDLGAISLLDCPAQDVIRQSGP